MASIQYKLDSAGRFVIEDYNRTKPFSNFFPGIAGLMGIPMWVFYVNRGQGIASFGIENKDWAIMEFQPANKAYRLTALQGFRTFIKVRSGSGTKYWEPFQQNLPGTAYRKKQILSMSAHDLILEETNLDLGLSAKVQYFTLAEEPYAGLVRRLTIQNIGKKNYSLEVIDGLPMFVPYGLKDHLNKHISRTVEAWVKVRHVEKRAPFIHLNVEVSDVPQVKYIQEGNFYFGFDPKTRKEKFLTPIVEAARVFGAAQDFTAPEEFLRKDFKLPKQQNTANRTPCALMYAKYSLKPKSAKEVVSIFGTTHNIQELEHIMKQAASVDFTARKALRNEQIITEIKQTALTKSSSEKFDLYGGQTFLDNVLRGGLPVTIPTGSGREVFNVYSRKHGDLERDYNYFMVSPSFYSQGNGSYRDVNQNRRSDIWFNPDVRERHLLTFFNLIQADGYNPLVIKGAVFQVEDFGKLEGILNRCLAGHQEDGKAQALKQFFTKSFLPGDLLKLAARSGISLKVPPEEFLGQILEICCRKERADHGEGFWTDHWTYNLDLLENYLAVYPEDTRGILLEKKKFSFFHNLHYVQPRDWRYVLTEHGVRQYHAVAHSLEETPRDESKSNLRTQNGAGEVYAATLLVKVLCLIANKAATLDPSGIGVEMEADKPNWYDALNGLPGLLGSSISETIEIKRHAVFLSGILQSLRLNSNEKIPIFEELAVFISGLTHALSQEQDAFAYWSKANDLKEHYRLKIRNGIDGAEKELTIGEIQNFLNLTVERVERAERLARNPDGSLATYFTHEVTKYETLGKARPGAHPNVRPLKFQKHALPLFLEGYVHALRAARDREQALELYRQVRQSSLFDKKLKMYKVNADLSGESEEIGRTRVFPPGWLENESVWLHMEYKFLLELLRQGLVKQFYENFEAAFIPFLKPEIYGRSILENSSFIVSSAHQDKNLHGQGFVARLSGSTAEFLHIWLLMNAGPKPFSLNEQGGLVLNFRPALRGNLFLKQPAAFQWHRAGNVTNVTLPSHSYAFSFLGSILVVYHNPKRRDTFGTSPAKIIEIKLQYPGGNLPVELTSETIPPPYAQDIRSRKIERIDVELS